VFIADYSNQRIRKFTVSTGIISTIAGSSTSGSYSGDGSQATSANLNGPISVGLDTSGNVYVGDSLNQRVRKITISTGIITTIAGTGTSSFTGDTGAATSATLSAPRDVTVDSLGNVFIVDKTNNRIRKITATTGIITTIVGSGGTGTTSGGYSGDGGTHSFLLLHFSFLLTYLLTQVQLHRLC